ncbi:MAG TPA: MBL fold metallo-hydrolase [Pyrinomonadaceae bacterium]|nr:MBL fold metallo-hydrolase [Pyrinomonadaceae bacterium]
MKRLVAWSLAFALYTALCAPPQARAHALPHGAAAPQGNNLSQVQITTTKVAGNVSMLVGSGGNIGVSAGPDGLLMIDDQYAPLAEKIRAALRELNPGRLKFVLNTHWHSDHTGGNANFGADSTLVAHANVRARLASGSNAPGRNIPPAPAIALPIITFDTTLHIHFNGEEVRVIHFPAGHTDGDSIIFFTTSNVIHMGDHFFAGRFPFVDTGSGGSVEGLIRNVADVIARAPAGVKIIPGHGPLSTIDDLKTYHQMLIETRDIVRQRVAQGRTLEQIKAEGLPEKWKSWGTGYINTESWIETLFRSIRPGGSADLKTTTNDFGELFGHARAGLAADEFSARCTSAHHAN